MKKPLPGGENGDNQTKVAESSKYKSDNAKLQQRKSYSGHKKGELRGNKKEKRPSAKKKVLPREAQGSNKRGDNSSGDVDSG